QWQKPWQAAHHLIIAEVAQAARESLVATPTFPSLSSHPDRQLNGERVGRTRRASEVSEKGNVGSHGFQLISVAGLDDDRDPFIRADVFSALSALLTDESWWRVDYAGDSATRQRRGARFRLSPDVSRSVQAVRQQCRDGIPQIFLSAHVRCTVAVLA